MTCDGKVGLFSFPLYKKEGVCVALCSPKQVYIHCERFSRLCVCSFFFFLVQVQVLLKCMRICSTV